MIGITKSAPANKVVILLYHQVGEQPNAQTNLDCFCNHHEFYRQMEFLREAGYVVISLTQAVDIIFQKKIIDQRYVVLTFDDGCEKFYEITYPTLALFGFPAAIYPVAGFLGKHALWGKVPNPDLKILSKSRLVELSQLGVEIGAHSMSHVKLTQVNRKEAMRQVSNSKDVLEQLLGKNISSFAYPHGDFNGGVIEILKEIGFSNALTCIPKNAEDASSVFEIPRKYITYYDNLNQFKEKLC